MWLLLPPQLLMFHWWGGDNRDPGTTFFLEPQRAVNQAATMVTTCGARPADLLGLKKGTYFTMTMRVLKRGHIPTASLRRVGWPAVLLLELSLCLLVYEKLFSTCLMSYSSLLSVTDAILRMVLHILFLLSPLDFQAIRKSS